MRFDASALLPLVAKLGGFLRSGFDQYVTLRSTGVEPSPELLAAFLSTKMEGWSPRVKGRDILDDETRASCARFLGGVAYNIALAQRKEEAA